MLLLSKASNVVQNLFFPRDVIILAALKIAIFCSARRSAIAALNKYRIEATEKKTQWQTCHRQRQ